MNGTAQNSWSPRVNILSVTAAQFHESAMCVCVSFFLNRSIYGYGCIRTYDIRDKWFSVYCSPIDNRQLIYLCSPFHSLPLASFATSFTDHIFAIHGVQIQLFTKCLLIISNLHTTSQHYLCLIRKAHRFGIEEVRNSFFQPHDKCQPMKQKRKINYSIPNWY